MSITKAITYKTDSGQEVELSLEIVRKYLLKEEATLATDKEIISFISLCVYQKLNPFLNEVYLLKSGTNPASIVIGKDVFTKRASQEGLYSYEEMPPLPINLETAVQKPKRYEYIVSADNLTSTDDINPTVLPIEQSYKVDDKEFTEAKALTGTDNKILTNGTNGLTTVEHRFRVPFNMDYNAGTYTGTITFKVVSL